MKKFSGLLLVTCAAASLSACSWTLPTCYDELNECGRDSAYTEERTAKAGKKPAPRPAPEPVIQATPRPEPMPEPMPEPPPPPAPEPVVIDDSAVMQDAEPMVKHISK